MYFSILSLLLASCASAHMFISSPTPISGTAPKDPLESSGANFPCHGVALPKSGGQTFKAGSQQTLSWELGGGSNTAVHGGGSCQLSVTYVTDVTKLKDPASWKVIYSIEGGCPTDASGNLETAVACPENAPNCVNSFNWTVPTGLKNGHAIIAWTWFNTIGNREIYMNCVNAQISGGDGSEMDSLPAMFVANLASIDICPTTEQYNVKFPDPGKYVTTHTQGNPYPLAVPTGAGCLVASARGSSSASPTADSSSSAAISALPIAETSSPAPSKTDAPATSSSAPKAQHGTSSSGKCASGQTACSTPGDIICIDPTHFGICDIDNCAISQAVALGTTCSDGKIMRKRGWKRSLEEHKRKHGYLHVH